MSMQIIEVEEHSLEAARIAVQQRVQPGHIIIKETVLSDGSTKKSHGWGTSVEEARQEAQSKVPAKAVVEKVNVVQEPMTEVRTVLAFDEIEARKKANVPSPLRIGSISIAKAGSPGIFGIGRKPTSYAMTLTAGAEVEIVYQPLAMIRVATATPEMVPSMKATFWERGGPIQREYQDDEQQIALLGLAVFAHVGNATAASEIARILRDASTTLLEVREFSTYHGYQRQQIAAEILGLVGDMDCIQTLEKGLRLQSTHAGCTEYSNQSSREIVEQSINQAISKLRRSQASSAASEKANPKTEEKQANEPSLESNLYTRAVFERYKWTEPARRVLMYARDEASQSGSPIVESEHMLLGLMREDKALISSLLSSPSSIETIPSAIQGRTPVREKILPSTDLPISHDCSRILDDAAEEAERSRLQQIRKEDILRGILREDRCGAARILREHHVKLPSGTDSGYSRKPPADQIDWTAVRTLLPKVAAKNKSDRAFRLPLTTLSVERDPAFGSTFVVWRYFNDIDGDTALKLLNSHLAEIGLEATIYAHTGDGDNPAAMRCLFKVIRRSN